MKFQNVKKHGDDEPPLTRGDGIAVMPELAEATGTQAMPPRNVGVDGGMPFVLTKLAGVEVDAGEPSIEQRAIQVGFRVRFVHDSGPPGVVPIHVLRTNLHEMMCIVKRYFQIFSHRVIPDPMNHNECGSKEE